MTKVRAINAATNGDVGIWEMDAVPRKDEILVAGEAQAFRVQAVTWFPETVDGTFAILMVLDTGQRL